ncbi:MAG TPA: amidohydrolase family protein [Vicinamibacteria bacterium]|nr:amidohydrolase family protein [Vicinamibacteria bacterium]
MSRGGRRALALAALALALAAAGAAAQTEAPAARPIAIRGARLVTVAGGVIERGTIVLQGGTIAALGADVAVPAGAEVVDGAGKVVYPGLIDALTTLGLTEIGSVPGSVDITETGDVNPHLRAWIAVQPHSELIPVARANGITAVLTAPQGGLVSGQSALLRLAGSTPDALALRQPVAMHMVFPTGRPAFDFARLFEEPELKTFEERVKERRRNQEKALRRLGHLLQDARAHGARIELARRGDGEAPRVDLAEEALVPVARGELPVVMRADAEEDIRGAVAFAGEHGLRLILAGGLEAWRCASLLREKDVPVLLTVDRLPQREADRYDAAFTNPAAVHRAGVRFAIVSDDASQVRNLPYEAAMARAFGLPPEAALRAITLSPAEILGVADRLGSLERGKDATVIVTTGDVMDHRTEITHVFIDGVAQPLETRHTRLYRQFKDRP